MNLTSKHTRAVRILDKKTMNETVNKQFYTEMLLLMSCDHPSIVRFFEIFQDVKRFYIITELCYGGELFKYIEELIDRDCYMKESTAANIITNVLSAVSYLHKNHIIMMDLKPENIIFSE